MGRRARGRSLGLFDNNSSVDLDEDDDLDDQVGDNDVNDLDDDEEPDALADGKGKVRMEKLLAALLGALGIDLPHDVGEKDFKQALASAALAKIKTLTGKGNGKSGNGKKSTTNPLLKGPSVNGELLQEEQGPMMSLGRIAAMDPAAQRIALALNDEYAANRQKKQANDAQTARQRENLILAGYAKRDARIARILKVAPQARRQLDVALASMSFSIGTDGSVVDPAESVLATLEKGLAEMLAKQPPPADPKDDSAAVAALARYMG